MNSMTFYITDRVLAQMNIDLLIVDQPGAMDSAVRQLNRAVTAEAEAIAGRPGPDDFFIEERPGKNFTRLITSTWSPVCARLSGGPNDGEEFPALREGWEATRIWKTAGLPQAPEMVLGEFLTSPSPTYTYVLAGIDGMRSVWVYEYKPGEVL